MLIECNICHRDFNHTGSTVKKIGKYQVGSFKCPYCGQEYLSYVKDKQVDRMQNDILSLNKALVQNAKSNRTHEYKKKMDRKLMKKIKKLKVNIHGRMNKLKEEYSELQTNGA